MFAPLPYLALLLLQDLAPATAPAPAPPQQPESAPQSPSAQSQPVSPQPAASQPAATLPAALEPAATQPADSRPAAPQVAESQPAAPALDPAALAAFERMCTALDEGKPRPVVQSFRLRVAITTLQDGHPKEDTATLSWRAPESVRLVLDSGRRQGRGPSGYWLKDKAEVVQLVGRDFVDDRRDIDELSAMCHNFAALARAREWKLSRLVPLAAPPAELPHALGEVARALDWIELSSPDFRLVDAAATRGSIADGAKDYLVQIGLVRKEAPLQDSKARPGEPFLIALRERRGGIEIQTSALLLALGPLRAIDGLRVPGYLNVRRYGYDPLRPRGAFEESPSIKLGVAGDSRIGLALDDAEFAP
jgi:hypothetical protein